jgi:4-hydroxy-tetrahydrodipicolinate synthase
MKNSKNIFNGVFPILSTPFDDQGNINFQDLTRQVDWNLEMGVHGIGIAMASEIFKLSEHERDQVLSTVVKDVKERIPVVMNTGAEGTFLSIQYSKKAENLGANALMIRPPVLMGVHPLEVKNFFIQVAEKVNIPIFMQDQPDAQISPQMAISLSQEHENLCYVKCETPPTVPRVKETIDLLPSNSQLVVFGGAGGMFMLEEIKVGSVGTMPNGSMSDVLVEIWNLWEKGDQINAEKKFSENANLLRLSMQSLGIANWLNKYILVKKGVIKSSFPRSPSLKPDVDQFLQIDRLFENN